MSTTLKKTAPRAPEALNSPRPRRTQPTPGIHTKVCLGRWRWLLQKILRALKISICYLGHIIHIYTAFDCAHSSTPSSCHLHFRPFFFLEPRNLNCSCLQQCEPRVICRSSLPVAVPLKKLSPLPQPTSTV